MLTPPIPNLDPLLDLVMLFACFAACLLTARSLRRTRDMETRGIDPELANLLPTDCPWHLVGRHPNGKTWMYICADFHGILRAQKSHKNRKSPTHD